MGLVEIVSAGFPCPPFSSIGKRLAQEDEGNFWPDTIRTIRLLGPRFALLENVSGFLTFDYFGEILGDLAEAGYDAEWGCWGSCAVGAPHMRQRVFVVAYPQGFTGPEADSSSDTNRKTQRTRMGDCCRMWQEMARFDWEIPPSWVLRDIDGLASRMDRTILTGNGVNPFQALPAWEEILRLAGVE